MKKIIMMILIGVITGSSAHATTSPCLYDGARMKQFLQNSTTLSKMQNGDFMKTWERSTLTATVYLFPREQRQYPKILLVFKSKTDNRYNAVAMFEKFSRDYKIQLSNGTALNASQCIYNFKTDAKDKQFCGLLGCKIVTGIIS